MLTDARDKRWGPFCLTQGKLDSSCAPSRVQFFIWLMVHGRVQCRTNLFRKTIVDSPVCEVYKHADETSEHIAFGCSFAELFWAKLGFQPAPAAANDCIFNITCPYHYPKKHFSTFAALCCWHLWKRRNAVIFRDELCAHRTTSDLDITVGLITARFMRIDSDVPLLPVMSLKMRKWLGLG